jgi:hypothetical protein
MVGDPEVIRSRSQDIGTEKRATGVCQTGCKGTHGSRLAGSDPFVDKSAFIITNPLGTPRIEPG